MSREEGLQLERTTLAWWRMTLAVLAFSALAVHAAPALVLLFASVAAGMVGCTVVRGRSRGRPPSAPPVAVVQASALLLTIAALGTLLLLR